MKRLIFNLCVIFALIYTLAFPYEISYCISVAIKLCATAVVPSLFMFIVLSKVLSHIVKSRCFSGRFSLLLSRIFNLPQSLLPICICGLFCGAPSGTVGVTELYSSGLCTKDEAERALILSNNCSAAFILSIASSSLGSMAGAVIILFSNIATSLLVYLVLFRGNTKGNTEKTRQYTQQYGIPYIITDSISSAVNTIIGLCGYVIFFYCLSAIISEQLWLLLIRLTNNSETAMFFKTAVSSLLEMTTGVLTAASLSGNIKILMISGGIAFCGLSVIFQVMSIASRYNISCSSFALAKCLSAFVSPLITLILLFIIPREVSVMKTYSLNTSGGFTSEDLIVLVFITCVFFIGAALLSYLDKKHKN